MGPRLFLLRVLSCSFCCLLLPFPGFRNPEKVRKKLLPEKLQKLLHVDFTTQADLWAGMHLTQYQNVVGAGLRIGRRYVVVNDFGDQRLPGSVT